MNFQTILEELNKLYEEEKVEAEAEANELMEDADEEILIDDEPITDDEVEESSEEPDEEAVDTPKQLILECSNCGGLVIKAEADVTVDDETDLANVDEKCQYCEEAKGYKITGEVIPYEGVVEDTDEADDADEVDDDLEEGIFDKFKKKKEEPKDSNEGKDPYLGKNMWCAIEKDHGFWKPAMLPFDEGSKDEDIARRKEQDDPNNYHVVRYDDVAELFNRKKDKNNDDSAKEESEGITTYTADEWERAEDIAYNIYTKSGKGGSGKVWDEVVEFSACPNLATDIIDYMNAYFGYGKYEKGYDKTKRLNPMDFAKHLEENLEEGIFDKFKKKQPEPVAPKTANKPKDEIPDGFVVASKLKYDGKWDWQGIDGGKLYTDEASAQRAADNLASIHRGTNEYHVMTTTRAAAIFGKKEVMYLR